MSVWKLNIIYWLVQKSMFFLKTMDKMNGETDVNETHVGCVEHN
jgi:hypothetical protein